MHKIKVVLFFLFWTSRVLAQDQKPAFWDDVQAFKKQDSVSSPPQDAILFTGSSSFTLWKDVQQYFPSHIIINRGFGGSSLPDLIRYADDVILPYQARQMVIYCGENDLAGSDTVTAQLVFQRFKRLFTIIRDRYPKVKLTYISMKPSPSRFHLMSKMLEANLLIKNFFKEKKENIFCGCVLQHAGGRW